MKILENGRGIVMGLEDIDLDLYPHLEVIGCNMTGLDHLPLDEIEKRGIEVISLQGETEFLEGIFSTAEHTVGLMIALARNYKTALNPPYKDREEYKGHTLSGKTLGIIGYGRVGKQVSEIAQAFGMRAIHVEKEDLVTTTRPYMFAFLNEADVVSLHIPLANNDGFFTKEMFGWMRPHSYLINTSRSGIIEPGALKYALENQIIAGAAIDFVDDPELVAYAGEHNNLLLTPHLGGCTEEDMERTERFIEDKVTQYLNGI